MTEIILTIAITLPEPEPPAPDGTEIPEPVLTREQSPVCRCCVKQAGRFPLHRTFDIEKRTSVKTQMPVNPLLRKDRVLQLFGLQ